MFKGGPSDRTLFVCAVVGVFFQKLRSGIEKVGKEIVRRMPRPEGAGAAPGGGVQKMELDCVNGWVDMRRILSDEMYVGIGSGVRAACKNSAKLGSEPREVRVMRCDELKPMEGARACVDARCGEAAAGVSSMMSTSLSTNTGSSGK